MENFDVNSFDFDSMSKALGSNPFDSDKKSYKDERFYTLPKNKDGSGQAIVALLPDAFNHTIVRMYKINTTIQHGGKRSFCSEWSPRSIGLPCPFYETYINHYDEDNDLARKFKPQEKWVCNIKVISDPAEPSNNGKIFLYEMSKTMAQMLENTLKISEAELQMGMKRKEIFNPFKGWILNLKCFKKPENGITDYSASKFDQLPNGGTIYTIKGEPLTDAVKTQAIEEIKTKCYDLGEFRKPESFKSYDELTKSLEMVCQGIFGIGKAKGGKPEVTVNIETPSSEIKPAGAPNIAAGQATSTAPISPTASQPVAQPAAQVVQAAPATQSGSVDDDLAALISGL